MEILYFGYTSKMQRRELLAEPKAPSNYKPDTARKWLEETGIPAQDARASKLPWVATLTSLVIHSQDSTTLAPIFKEESDRGGTVSGRFMQFLQATYPNRIREAIKGDDTTGDPLYFVGLGIKNCMRMIGAELLIANAGRVKQWRVPLRLWYNPLNQIDPGDIPLSSSEEKDLDIYGVLEALQIDVPGGPVAMQTDPNVQAIVTRELTTALQLFGLPEE